MVFFLFHDNDEKRAGVQGTLALYLLFLLTNPPFQNHEEGTRLLLVSHLTTTTSSSYETRDGGVFNATTNRCGSAISHTLGPFPRRQWAAGAKGTPIFLVFFHQCNEERLPSPCCVFCLFSMVRRVLALLVVFAVCSQRRGGAKSSSLWFLLVFNGEEGQNPPHHVFCSFMMVRRGTPCSPFFFTHFNGEEGYGPPLCVFCLFSTARRAKPLLDCVFK